MELAERPVGKRLQAVCRLLTLVRSRTLPPLEFIESGVGASNLIDTAMSPKLKHSGCAKQTLEGKQRAGLGKLIEGARRSLWSLPAIARHFVEGRLSQRGRL